jgi:hypothetical protein
VNQYTHTPVHTGFPLPLPALTPHIGVLIRSHQKLLEALRDFDPERTLASIAGLLTVPEWQSSTLRLEVLQHFIAIAASGARKPKRADFKRWLTEIGNGIVGSLEDPAEDVFVSRVLIPGEDCLIFEGVYESAAFHAQRFINILDEMPDQGNYVPMKQAAYGLLRLSTEVVRRSGIPPFTSGGLLPLDQVSDDSLGNLVKLRARAQFTLGELRQLGIDQIDLAIFIFDPTNRADLEEQSIGHTSLERRPLVMMGDDLYFALPTATSMAIRRMIIEACSGQNMEEMLYAGYKREIYRALAALPLLGGSIGTPVSFQRINEIYVANVARYVDEGRLLHVCIVIDDLTTYATSGMTKPDPDPSRLSEVIQSSVAHAYEQFSSQNRFREGVSLIVLCTWGRPLFVEFDRPQDDRWRAESISAPDLETLSWEASFSPLELWRLLDGRDQLTRLNVHLANINGLLNLYSWSVSLDGHLIPHDQLPENYDPSFPLRIIIQQNALLDIRKRLNLAWNLHHAETWDGRNVKVRREAISSFFEEDKISPLYVSMDDLQDGELLAVYETQSRNWWTRVETPPSASRKFQYQLWHLTAIWTRRAAPILEIFLPTLPAGSLLWLTHFSDTGDVEPDSAYPSREEARKALRFNVTGNVVHVYADPSFILAFRNAKNIGESLLVEFFVRGAFELAGAEMTEEVIAAALTTIIPDEWARDMHLVPARDFRDFVRDRIPDKPILINLADDAYSRIGLGWQSRKRDEGAVIKGIDECCGFLGQVVDTLWDQLRADLKQHNKEALLRQLIANHESVMIETDSWMRSARAVLSLHDDKDATALVSARQIALFNGATLSSRVLIEMALCECPNSDERVAGKLDIARMLARALQIHQYGGWSEAIRYEGKQAELRITPLGDIFTQVDFDEKIASPYGEALGIRRFRHGAGSYETNFSEREPIRSAEGAFEPEFWMAWNQCFGFTIDEARIFMDNLDDRGIEQQEFMFTATLQELARLGSHGKLSAESVRSILDALVLKPRFIWDSTPEGFEPRDWYPWRFRRRLSVVTRPILQISEEPDARYLVAPSMVRNAVAKLMEYCHRGGFEAKDFPLGLMRSWIGAAENKRGHRFNEEVADRLNSLGWHVRTNIKLTEILRAKTDKDYGDIDVLAWRDGRILAIECKDLELAMTTGEIARQLYEFRGEDNSRGRPDRLKRHLMRVDLLKQRIAAVRSFTRSGDEAGIEAAVVFGDIVPMTFAEVAARRNVLLVTVDELETINGKK